MARKKSAAPNPVESEEESQEIPDEEPDAPEPARRAALRATGKREVTSKADAVRRALAAGMEGPQEGTAWIRKEFGIEIAPQHFSATKSQIKKREGGGKPGRKPKGTPSQAVEGYLAPPPNLAPASGSELLDAMEVMKPLVA